MKTMDIFIFKYLDLLAFFLSIFVFFCLIWVILQIKNINRLKAIFLQTEKGNSLENALINIYNELGELKKESLINAEEIKKLQDSHKLAIQKIGVVRYSPFADGGGNYSFSIALLNQNDTGVIITNMYGRQQSRVYTKKILNKYCETPLTEEEKQAILEATNN